MLPPRVFCVVSGPSKVVTQRGLDLLLEAVHAEANTNGEDVRVLVPAITLQCLLDICLGFVDVREHQVCCCMRSEHRARASRRKLVQLLKVVVSLVQWSRAL